MLDLLDGQDGAVLAHFDRQAIRHGADFAEELSVHERVVEAAVRAVTSEQ
jgi:hypothetical protein